MQPQNWEAVGSPITLKQIEEAMRQVVSEIPCDCLSFSGGLDSSLLLYLMLEAGKDVRVFTITCSDNHPDIYYSLLVLKYLKKRYGVQINSMCRSLPDVNGDNLVKAFYDGVRQHTDSIITGDGIDELMAGYYGHQKDLSDDTYYNYLRRLWADHLEPLDKNSGDIRVYLPYLDERVTSLLWQIPLSEKVDRHCRKKLMVQLAQGKLPQEVIERRKYGFGTIP